MDDYLTSFINYLTKNTSNELAGVIIYGSYVRGYFDSQKSDSDVFVLFKSKVIDLQEEIKLKFPKVSLQLYLNLEDFKSKIVNGGWNTYITCIYTGKTLYETKELIELRDKIIKYSPDIKNLDKRQISALIAKLKADTQEGYNRDKYDLNKFLYSSLLRKLQILYYLRIGKLELEFSNLIVLIKDPCISDNLKWLRQIEKHVFERSEDMLSPKEKYLEVLEKVDEAIQKELE